MRKDRSDPVFFYFNTIGKLLDFSFLKLFEKPYREAFYGFLENANIKFETVKIAQNTVFQIRG